MRALKNLSPFHARAREGEETTDRLTRRHARALENAFHGLLAATNYDYPSHFG